MKSREREHPLDQRPIFFFVSYGHVVGSVFSYWPAGWLESHLLVNLQEKMNGTFETMVRQYTEIQHCELLYLQISRILFVDDPDPFRQMYKIGHIEYTNNK